MKTAREVLLAIVGYGLLYLGANDGLWPRVAHFHHHEWQPSALLDGAISSVLLPFLIAGLLSAICRRRTLGAFGWSLVAAPLALLLVMKYVVDALYAPFWTESLSLLVVGAIQGASAFAGWTVFHLFEKRTITTTVPAAD
jgi:hypothetical protein